MKCHASPAPIPTPRMMWRTTTRKFILTPWMMWKTSTRKFRNRRAPPLRTFQFRRSLAITIIEDVDEASAEASKERLTNICGISIAEDDGASGEARNAREVDLTIHVMNKRSRKSLAKLASSIDTVVNPKNATHRLK
uniref:Uncharacterized protein n=1 Tax=Spongospora subterranea TaxID=70186 RepID=A0A0H5QZ84_9EUKA|eukprot:CRZ00864.1 hypothetical protein [Spongospora subterranea]